MITQLYDGKVTIDFKEKKHYYYVNGKYVPSVTTIANCLDDGKTNNLMGWQLKLLSSFVQDNIESVLSEDGRIDELRLVAFLKAFKAAPRTTRDDAGDVGTAIHGVIRDHILHSLGQMNAAPVPVNENIAYAYDLFKEWENSNHVEWEFTERPVYSVQHEYVGTLDALAWVNHKLTLVDYKTSKGDRIYNSYRLQIAGYAGAVEEEFGEPVEKRIILKLPRERQENKPDVVKDLDVEFPGIPWKVDYETFLHLREAYRWFKGA